MKVNKRTISRRKSMNCDILMAALRIGNRSGWNSLTMRKIAESINYSPPVIYEYFKNKAAILLDLTKHGFLILHDELKHARSASAMPRQQLLFMCKAYCDFASAEPELYRLMFGVGTSRADRQILDQTSTRIDSLFCEVIGYLPLKPYYTCWSVLHGLISIRLNGTEIQPAVSEQIFKAAVTNFMDVVSPSDHIT